MALSFVQYPGDGGKRDFQLTFGYLAKAHVSVSVNGTPYPDFTFTSSFMVQLAAAPAKDAIVEVRRTTPRNAPLVDFVDGSTLTETDLDTATLQVFYLAQEAYDMAGGTLAITSDGSYSANTRRIANVGNPVNGQDAVTKLWAETALSSQLAAAIVAKDASVIARQGAETARVGAEVARTGAESARDEARALRDTASAHRLNAQNAQSAAETARTGAEAAKVGLEAARDTAITKAGEATASAAAAAKSAQDAAIFDPSSYYTKTQTDAKYATPASVAASFYTQAQINTALNSRDSAINDRVRKSAEFQAQEIVGPLGVWDSFTIYGGGNKHIWFMGNDKSERGLIFVDDAGNMNLRYGKGNQVATFSANSAVSFSGYGELGSFVETRSNAYRTNLDWAAVGSLIMAKTTTRMDLNPGNNVLGSSLQPANARGGVQRQGTLPGTWRCMGQTTTEGSDADNATSIFRRVA